MTSKEKAWELSKLLAKYAEDEESYFTFNRSGLEEAGYKRTSIFPNMQSDLSQWKIPKLRKIDWLKVPVNTLVNVRDFPSNKPLAHYFALFMPDSCNKFRVFNDGLLQSRAKTLTNWQYCEIHPDVEIQEEWYEDK